MQKDYTNIPIAEFPAGNHGLICVTVSKNKNHGPKIDVRLFTPNKNGAKLVPTKSGIRIPSPLAKELIAAIRKATEVADSLGANQ